MDKRRFLAALHKGSRHFKWEALMRDDTRQIEPEHALAQIRHCWARSIPRAFDEEAYIGITFEPYPEAKPVTAFAWCWTPWRECQGDCGTVLLDRR